ncbi:la protein homolog isoform X2 [Temnothorax longispinosus]|uniref:la protein homolog isoform X2 n=1 Tax=Temnothorax longispinosus TaxID=300112 RepID=UPI003A98D13F
MENEQEETSVGDDQLNGDTATEVNDDAPTVDATDEKTEQQTKANGKDTEEEEPSEDLLTKIKAQVEYYFGNVNMQRDKFLIEQTKLDEGWIPMTVMLNFKMLASLSKNVDVILKALETSDLIEISEDKKKIRRSLKHPLPEFNEGYRKAQEARTVYVKGFPLTDTTIDKLKAFFEPYKPFETIVMRKYQDKDKVFKFKGSVFVQFETVDVADAFMKAESVKYEDTELLRKWAADYNAGKAQEKEERRKKKADKTKKTTEQKETEGDEEQPAATDNKLPKGSIIFFSGVSKTCTREDIKECLDKFDADIAYIDFQRGHTEGWVRLQGENAAKPVLDKTDEGKVVIQDIEVTCKILEGEEEDKYLAKVMEEMVASKNKYNKAKRAGRARGAKKRGSSPSRDAVLAKKKAVE